ncbi:HAD family hydrolase [Pelagibius sp.]|uniref:HAD family hydrolase n=1 Tax=Pelagibius sp. TaxID=1931238 RepID=UPI003B50E432
MTLPAPAAILFDWDNTLVDSWGVIHHALSVTLQAMGQRPWTLEEARRNVRKSARDSFPELFGARAEEAMEIFYRTFEQTHLEKLNPFPGAEAMLEGLAARGRLPMAVISNKKGVLLRRETEALGWDRHFIAVVGATDAPRDKPAPEVVELALSGSGVAAGPTVWFVGDTDIDLLCARNSGCSAVLLRDQPPAPGEFADVEPHAHVRDCPGLAALVARAAAPGG